MRQFLRTTAMVASTTVALGASDAGSCGQSTGAAPAAKPKAISACALLPKAEVKKIAAPDDQFFDMVPPKEEQLPAGGSACAYSGIHVQVNPFTPARLEELRKEKGNQWAAVPDVGDAAYFHDNNRSTSVRFGELYARVGQNVLTIQMSVRPPSASAETVRLAAVSLAKALAAKLR